MKILLSITPKFMLVMVFITSCSPITQEYAPTQVKSTNSPVPTITSTPTSSPLPTATQSLVDKVFVIPTRKPYEEVTPTPIATPASSSMTMKLRDIVDNELT